MNLLPLCPNHHLTDQHDPTRKIDPILLRLFRQHKDPQMLSSRFEPVFKRLKPVLNITNDMTGFDVRDHLIDLAAFVKHINAGSYYADRIDELVRIVARFAEDPRDPDSNMLSFDDESSERARRLAQHSKHDILALVVEQLRYQEWPPYEPRTR